MSLARPGRPPAAEGPIAAPKPAIDVVVSDEAFGYLRVQRGRIADLAPDDARADRGAWERAYRAELARDYGEIAPVLPATCRRLLDIGSGLGGLDVLLARHYGGAPQVWLLDGEADAAVVARHASTFCDRLVAMRFLAANRVRLAGYLSPADAARLETLSGAPGPFDLVVSTQAWGFHFEPQAYLAFVRRRLARGGRVIVDLRVGKPSWRAAFGEAFKFEAILATTAKYVRTAFRSRD